MAEAARKVTQGQADWTAEESAWARDVLGAADDVCQALLRLSPGLDRPSTAFAKDAMKHSRRILTSPSPGLLIWNAGKVASFASLAVYDASLAKKVTNLRSSIAKKPRS